MEYFSGLSNPLNLWSLYEMLKNVAVCMCSWQLLCDDVAFKKWHKDQGLVGQQEEKQEESWLQFK